MAKDNLDNQVKEQISIKDILAPPERLIAVSRIFAQAQKDMSLAEQKTFVYALSQINFKDDAKSNYVKLDKKTLAKILGINSDTNHLSVDLFQTIKDLPKHSYIKIADKDLDFYSSGVIITNITFFKNIARIKFEEEYIQLFTGLTQNYITMWSTDIFQMNNKRSVQFYEYLRQITDTRKDINDIGLGIKALKEMFNIPKEGKGSYMRDSKNGGFNRSEFEKKIIDPLCEDLKKCKMINLIIQPDGKPYKKIKRGNRVDGYRFYWTFTKHPATATAEELKEIKDNPEVIKIAKDILKGKKNQKKKNNTLEQNYDINTLEKELVENI